MLDVSTARKAVGQGVPRGRAAKVQQGGEGGRLPSIILMSHTPCAPNTASCVQERGLLITYAHP